MNFLIENQSCWETILNAKMPVVIYGTGNAADKIIDFCKLNNITIAGIFASNDFARGQIFRGHKVERYLDVVNRLGNDFLLVIAFASKLPEILSRFQELAAKHLTVVPHLGLYNDDVVTISWLDAHKNDLESAYNLLADDLSRQVFLDMLNYKFSGKMKYLFQHATLRENDLKLFDFSECETYFDLGAYTGDTVQEFLNMTDGKYGQIVAFEADKKNFDKLCANHNSLNNFLPLNLAAWNKEEQISFAGTSGRQASIFGSKKKLINADTIDNIAQKNNVYPSYIKMDVEGAEMQALEGGAECLKKCKPKLLLAGYHFDADLFRIPLFLHKINPDYQIFLRKHPYVPDWEINFFAK